MEVQLQELGQELGRRLELSLDLKLWSNSKELKSILMMSVGKL